MTTILLDSPERVAYAQKIIGKVPLDRAWDCTIEPHVERRTIEQNSRYWAILQKIAEHTGYTAADVHEFALARFFGYVEQKIVAPSGEMILRHVPVKRSSTRDKAEFARLMEATEEWGISEFGVFLGDE